MKPEQPTEVKRIKLLDYEVEALQEIYEEALPSNWTDGLRMNDGKVGKAFYGSTIEEVMWDVLGEAADSMELYEYQMEVRSNLQDVEFEVSGKQYDEIMLNRKEIKKLSAKQNK